MTHAITLRLDDADFARLEEEADAMRVKPGTLARILVHRALTSEMRSTTAAERAIGRLVARSRAIPGDAVELVAESRGGLER